MYCCRSPRRNCVATISNSNPLNARAAFYLLSNKIYMNVCVCVFVCVYVCLYVCMYVARTGERRVVYRILVGKREGKRLFGRPRRRWEDNIKMDFQEVGCGDMDRIDLASGRDSCRALVNAVMNL